MSQSARQPDPASTVNTTTLRLTSLGGATGVVFPQALLSRLGVQEGDDLELVESPDGYRLRVVGLESDDAAFAAQMAVAEDVMRRRASVLKRLAE